MPINVSHLKLFLDNTIQKNSEQGLVVGDLSRLYDEWNERRSSRHRVQPQVFVPLVELYVLLKIGKVDMEVRGGVRKIRGVDFKTDDLRRLASIFVNGNGSTPDNQPTITSLFGPIISLSEPPQQ